MRQDVLALGLSLKKDWELLSLHVWEPEATIQEVWPHCWRDTWRSRGERLSPPAFPTKGKAGQ